MRPLLKVVFAALPAFFLIVGNLHATGYYGPDNYLDNGGKNVDASPEFFWELEVKRLARQFHPPEKRIAPEIPKESSEDYSERGIKRDQSVKVDTEDFVRALKEGKIKPPDPAKAQQQQEAARKAIEQTVDESATPPPDASPPPTKESNAPLPEEFPSEFSDYHKGAYAYTSGPAHYAEAKAAWEALLKRPEAERPYRTIWATFMLGKLALKNGDFAGAAKIFQQIRAMAKAGVVDSLGLAADSYGWEGRAEWKQGHSAKAAELFLTQLATGDESAIISLKALIPDREPIEGLLNYGAEPDERGKWDDQQKRGAEAKEVAGLKAAAQDPLLRKLVTAHILATASTRDLYSDESGSKPVNRCARWLTTLAQVKPGQVDDAEYLGWVAYNNGDYKGAAKWLEMAKPEAPAALWLKAKMQRRAGKLSEAAQSMAKAWEGVRDVSAYTGWTTTGVADMNTPYRTEGEGLSWSFGQSASGDLGALRLTRGDFVQAFDTFRNGGLWNDAAFVGERVLTANELKSYVDQQTEPATDDGKLQFEKLRYLLGRRLVREDRYDEAASYLRPPYDKVMGRYVKALKDGADPKLGKNERAKAWFTAAWLARYDGMELMGTEVAPDVFVDDGQFELADLAQEFESGKYQTVKYDRQGKEQKISSPILLKPSPEELKRLAANRIKPDKRFHYRLIAGVLAMKAAALLPDNSEELADVINAAGLWVKDRDEATGNQYFAVLKQRAGKTKIGAATAKRKWFVDENGPWSTEQQTAHKAMQEELKISPP